MSEEMLIRHCSPTLAGIKTGSMFSCSYESIEKMRAAVRLWNKALSKKGIRLVPLRYCRNRALIYIYRPSRLKNDLTDKAACNILKSCGYCEKTPESCISRLVKRLAECSEFPHEIGLFLGYPPEDVSGFINNKASGCKCVGCWKVYGDEAAARKTFEKYKKCTEVYYTQYTNGRSVERLTVAG